MLAGAAAGFHFGGDRGHVVAAFEVEDIGLVGDCYNRSWCARENQVVTNTPGAGGSPAQILTNNVHTSTQTAGGLITSGPLKGTQFGPDGNVGAPFAYGQFPGSLDMVRGSGQGMNAYLQGVDIRTPVTRYNAFVHASYDLTDSITGFVEGSYSYVDGRNDEGYYHTPGNLTISASNPFVPAEVRSSLAAANATSFGYGRNWINLGVITGRDTTSTYRIVGGLRGDLFGDFKWDAYYQYGHVDYDQVISNDPIVANFKNALNSVRNSAGQIVCSITLTSPTSGCVPLNPFGNAVDPAAKAYVYGTSEQKIALDQHVAAVNIHGNLLRLPAGPVSVALGIEHREDIATGTADALSQSTAFFAGNGGNFHGQINVTEGYFENEIPILSNLNLRQSLSLNGAVRESSYSISGLITSWKVGSVYEPSDWLRFRVTRSRDIRAPSLNELYGPPQVSTTTITDIPALRGHRQHHQLREREPDAGTRRYAYRRYRADSPRRAPGAAGLGRLLYDRPHQRDQLADAQNVVTQCNLGNTDFCPFVIRDTNGVITQVNTPYLNLAKLQTSGLDIETQYTLPLQRVSASLPGTLNFDVLATYIAHLKTVQPTGSIDIAGETGCSPTSALLCVPTGRWM